MFNLGFGELAVIFIVLIIAVGPDRLPTMMKGLGKTIRTVRQASRDIRATVGIDELMREDLLQAPPRRPVPKAAIARPAAGAASLPSPEAPAPTENAKPAADATGAPIELAPPVEQASVEPVVPAPPAPTAVQETPSDTAPRKD